MSSSNFAPSNSLLLKSEDAYAFAEACVNFVSVVDNTSCATIPGAMIPGAIIPGATIPGANGEPTDISGGSSAPIWIYIVVVAGAIVLVASIMLLSSILCCFFHRKTKKESKSCIYAKQNLNTFPALHVVMPEWKQPSQ
jgi:hypothetical protein